MGSYGLPNTGVQNISLTPQQGVPAANDYVAQQMQIQRQQQLAQALQQQGNQDIPILSGGGAQAPIAWTSILAKVLDKVGSSMSANRAIKEQSDLSKEQQAAAQTAIQAFGNNPDTQGLTGGGSAAPQSPMQYTLQAPSVIPGQAGPSGTGAAAFPDIGGAQAATIPGGETTNAQKIAMLPQLALQSANNPYLQAAAPYLQNQIKSSEAPFKLGPNEVEYDGSGQPIAKGPTLSYHTLTPAQADAMGLPKPPVGSVYQANPQGEISVIKTSDMMSPGRMQQEAQLASTRAQASANAALGSPGSKDAIDLGGDYFIANGGKYPPNARSPALQMAIASNAKQKMDAAGQSMDDLVSKGIGLKGRGAAASQLGKLQAGTTVNEDTVNGSMNILNGLLKKGAASPGNITSLNELDQWASRQTNNPDAANLKNAIGAISNEYARVMTGTTGGTGSSDAARNEAAQRLLLGYNKGTMQAVEGQLHQEMSQRSTAQSGALNQVTGGNYGGVTSTIPYAVPPTTTKSGATVSNW